VITSFVWLKKDSSLVLQRIKTGMDDETQVQVISGLNTNDQVVTGYTQVKKADLTSKTEKSPFMPQRRARTPKKSSAGRPPG
jgi:HlyD family secretion protein